jgi:hypothetical protein
MAASFAKLMKRLGFVRLADYGLVLTPEDRVQSTRPHVLEDAMGSPIVGWLEGDLAVAELPPFGSAAPKHAKQFTIPSAALIASLSAPALPKFIDPAENAEPRATEPEPGTDWEWELALARARAAADESESAAATLAMSPAPMPVAVPVPVPVPLAKSPFAKPIVATPAQAPAVRVAPVAPTVVQPVKAEVVPFRRLQPTPTDPANPATEPGFKVKPQQPNVITSAVKPDPAKVAVLAKVAKVSTKGIPKLQVVKTPTDTQPGKSSARRNKTAPMTAQAAEPSRAPRGRSRAQSVSDVKSKTQPMDAATAEPVLEAKRLTGRRLARGTDPIGGVANDEQTAVGAPPVMEVAKPKPVAKLAPITALPSIKQRMAPR